MLPIFQKVLKSPCLQAYFVKLFKNWLQYKFQQNQNKLKGTTKAVEFFKKHQIKNSWFQKTVNICSLSLTSQLSFMMFAVHSIIFFLWKLGISFLLLSTIRKIFWWSLVWAAPNFTPHSSPLLMKFIDGNINHICVMTVHHCPVFNIFQLKFLFQLQVMECEPGVWANKVSKRCFSADFSRKVWFSRPSTKLLCR